MIVALRQRAVGSCRLHANQPWAIMPHSLSVSFFGGEEQFIPVSRNRKRKRIPRVIQPPTLLLEHVGVSRGRSQAILDRAQSERCLMWLRIAFTSGNEKILRGFVSAEVIGTKDKPVRTLIAFSIAPA